MMPSLTQILIGIVVLIFLSTYKIIWYYIKRLVFKPNVKLLMDARDIPGLFHALTYKTGEYDNDYIRTNAAIALGNIGDTNAIDNLVERLSDKDRNVTNASIQAIGQITLRCVRQPMFSAYQNRDQARLQTLLSTLQNIQLKTTSRLKYAYADSSGLQLVISTLGIISGPEAVDILINLIKDTNDNSIRKMAVQALASTGDPRMIDSLLKFLNKSNPDLQVACAEMLGNFKEKRAVNPLGKLLSSSTPSVRKAAAEALGKIGDPKVANKMIIMLSDQFPECRLVAANALADLGDKKWIQWIKGDNNDFNRIAESGEPMAYDILINAQHDAEVITALGILGDERAVDLLISKLGESEKKIQINTVIALGKIGDPKAVEPLVDLVTDKNSQLRKEAAVALDKLGSSQWIKWVKGEKLDFDRLAQSKDPRVFDLFLKMVDSEGVIQALGTLGDKRAVEPLIKKLEDNDEKIKMAALNSLEKLRDKQAVEPIKHLLVDSYGNIRKKAAAVLRKLGESQWETFISGGSEDFRNLIKSEDEYIVTESIYIVKAGLYSDNFSLRKETAKFLIQVAANPPAELKNYWKEISKEINTPHHDSHYDHDINRSSDCTHNDSHTDSGIGLKFPKLPDHFKKN